MMSLRQACGERRVLLGLVWDAVILKMIINIIDSVSSAVHSAIAQCVSRRCVLCGGEHGLEPVHVMWSGVMLSFFSSLS